MTTLDQPAASTRGPERKTRSAIPLLRPHIVWAIFKRDFLGYFSNPAGYVFIALFVAISSFATFCLPEFFANNLASLATLNQWMPYLLLFFVPAITMSIWAEERKQGTEELLLTLPARDVEVVLGKYKAALGIYTVSLLFLAIGELIIFSVYPGIGSPDAGVFFSTFVGYWLMGAMLIAFGMVASILSSNVTVAFILGGLFCALPVFSNLLGSMLGSLPVIGESLGRGLQALSVPEQFRDFGVGVLPLSGHSVLRGRRGRHAVSEHGASGPPALGGRREEPGPVAALPGAVRGGRRRPGQLERDGRLTRESGTTSARNGSTRSRPSLAA